MSCKFAICKIANCNRIVVCRGLCTAHYSRYKRYGNPLLGRISPEEARSYIDYLCSLKRQDNCVFWPFSTDKDGYAKLGKSNRVCRVICERVHGSGLSKQHAAHSCGKGMQGCVAWWHLEWKFGAENNADKIRHGTSSSGPKNPKVKLTLEQVSSIRASTQGSVSLAALYNVDRGTIHSIRSGKTWSKHL